jgi:hypothetical protein
MTTQGYNLPPVRIGDLVKLRGERSRIDGRRAQQAQVTAIIGSSGTESRSPFDRFILHDGRLEHYGLGRKDFRRIKS